MRDTIIPYSTARKLGWNVTFVGSGASYENVVATAQGRITEGFYALNGQEVIYRDQIKSAEVKAFFERYKDKSNQDPTYPAQLGYASADTVVEVLKRAGRELTTERFLKAQESIKDWTGVLGGPPVTYTSHRHVGSDLVFLAVVEKPLEVGRTQSEILSRATAVGCPYRKLIRGRSDGAGHRG